MNHPSSRWTAFSAIFAFVAVFMPVLAIFAPLAIAPLLVLVAVALLALDRGRIGRAIATLRWLLGMLASLALWGIVSTLWSIDPGHSAIEGLRFLGVCFCGAIVFAAGRSLTPGERRQAGRALSAGLVAALLVLAIERFGGTPIMRFWHPLPPSSLGDRTLVFFRYDRGMIVLVLLAWAVAFASVSRWLRLALLAATAAMTALMISTAAALAIAAGLVVFAAGWLFPRIVAGLIVAGVVALSIAIPLATPSYQAVAALHAAVPAIKWSGIHRLLIWRFASDRVHDRPWLGWGMDASRAMPGGHTDLLTLMPPGNYPPHTQALALPLHPHNAMLQLLLELGVPGVTLGIAIIASIVLTIGWRAPLTHESRAGALALIVSCLTIGLLSFGVWQEWWQATVWLAAAFFTATAAPRTPSAVEERASPPA